MKNITSQHRRFVEQYCAHFNGARAAREAGYAESRARRTAYDLLQDEDIQAMVSERLDELAMSAAEATKRMADIARADIGDFFDVEDIRDENGSLEDRRLMLNEEAVLEDGAGLIKEISYDANGNPRLKLYDGQKALKTILDAHGAFNHEQKVDLGGDVQIIFEQKAE